MKRLLSLCAVLAGALASAFGSDFILSSGQQAVLFVPTGEAPVVGEAVALVQRDYAAVLGAQLDVVHSSPRRAQIVAGLVTDRQVAAMARRHGVDLRRLASLHEGFTLRVADETDGACLLIVGSDKRGLAYGLMELSRLLGVSPWEWWADVPPLPRADVSLPARYEQTSHPDVAYRGIFINDEDWGMMPWASQNYEPRARGGEALKGEIGPQTHQRIFELLLRLRANLFWPAMHDCSRPFYLDERNQQMADRYGIIVSTSHCEPMMRNANGEWRAWAQDPKGSRYNYVANRDSVLLFWQQRVTQLRQSDCLYTLGMRGIHDGPMQGAKSIAEQVEALSSILRDQREMLRRTLGRDLTQIPQQFVPYKEVLDCYNNGLEVPDDVTLIWCDDNYGYVRHLPTAEERRRSGGHGLYYHISYWGRPHDYLWLATTHPDLIRSELLRAYDHGIDRIWVLNVGDIKPAEFETQFILDMAWRTDDFRADDAVDRYVARWYDQNVGPSADWAGLWRRFYDLWFDSKPEWMGGTRTEERDARWKVPADLPMGEGEVRQRLAECRSLAAEVRQAIGRDVPSARRAAAFQLVEYPMLGATAQGEKWLSAQLARHDLGPWWPARDAYRRIQTLTEEYDTMLDGKWRGMMDMKPRRLADFDEPAETMSDLPMLADRQGVAVYQSARPVGDPVAQGDSLTLALDATGPEVTLEVHTLPVHPADGRQIRYAIAVDGRAAQVVDFHTEGRSEEWKENVLRNRATRKVRLSVSSDRPTHTVTFRALDEGVRLQQIWLLP